MALRQRRAAATPEMGRLDQNKPRLINVVLPANKLQGLAVIRALLLRFSPAHEDGVYLRTSQTWEKRMRRREQHKVTRELGDGSSAQLKLVMRAPPQSPTVVHSLAINLRCRLIAALWETVDQSSEQLLRTSS